MLKPSPHVLFIENYQGNQLFLFPHEMEENALLHKERETTCKVPEEEHTYESDFSLEQVTVLRSMVDIRHMGCGFPLQCSETI